MLIEEWKDIKGYEGLYRISNYGKVLGVKRDKLKKATICTGQNFNKYLRIGLCENSVKKMINLNVLVYSTFIGDIKGMIDFKDGDFNNCRVDNLVDVDKTFKFKKAHCYSVLDTKTMILHSSMNDLAKYLCISVSSVTQGLSRCYKKYSHYKVINNA